MTEEQFQQLVALLGQIGNAAYTAAVRQAQVEAGTSLLWAVAFVVAAVVCYRVHVYGKKAMADDEYDAVGGISTLFGAAGLAGSILLSLMFLTDAIQFALNPQWAALEKLTELVR